MNKTIFQKCEECKTKDFTILYKGKKLCASCYLKLSEVKN